MGKKNGRAGNSRTRKTRAFHCARQAFSRKGQAPLVSHAIIVGFTIFLVYVVFTTFTALRDDYQKFVGGLEIKELCFIVRGSAEKVYTAADYNVSVNSLLGSIEVRLPDRVTDLKFNVRFVNKSALIESPGAEFNETCKIGFPAQFNGSTSGGLTRFSYTRLTNGTNVIEVVKL